jgi:hypothetical protein
MTRLWKKKLKKVEKNASNLNAMVYTSEEIAKKQISRAAKAGSSRAQ